jgi:hypothetical protein
LKDELDGYLHPRYELHCRGPLALPRDRIQPGRRQGQCERRRPNVAWVVCQPWEKNTMTWVEEYGIYASTASLVNGALLTQMSRSEFPV